MSTKPHTYWFDLGDSGAENIWDPEGSDPIRTVCKSFDPLPVMHCRWPDDLEACNLACIPRNYPYTNMYLRFHHEPRLETPKINIFDTVK